jgi:hypothetical protein
MLSLIYRELHLTRKTLVTCLLVYGLFALLTDLFALSMQAGNLAKYCSAEDLSAQLPMVPTAAIFGYFILLVTAPEAIFQVLGVDFKTPWLKYALSSPRTIREHIGAKYLAYLLMTGCAFLLGFLHLIIACALSGQGIPDGMLFLFFVSAMLVMMVSSIFLPIAYALQNMDFVNALFTIPVILLTLAYVLSAINFFIFTHHEDAEILDYVQHIFQKLQALTSAPFFNILKPLALLIAMLLIIGSYFLSVSILDKRRLIKGGTKGVTQKKGGNL